mgnify:FL=1
MEKVLVVGCCGAGKSTLSKKLEKILKLPLIHLDKYYHKPNWEEPEKDEWEQVLRKLVKQKRWIMDGNYADSFDIRFPLADTIIYLDYPSIKCCLRVIKRNIKYFRKKRSDIADGCKERFDLFFLKFVLTFNYKNRENIYNRLENIKTNKEVIILKNDKEVDLFLLKNRNSRTSLPKH